jgi:hypothetical protein
VNQNGIRGRTCTARVGLKIRLRELLCIHGRGLTTPLARLVGKEWSERGTGRRATLTLLGNGAAGRIRTCIVPLRKRMPRMFDHGSVEMVSAAGLAPAITRSQAEHVAPTLRAVASANGWRRGLGSCGDGAQCTLVAWLHRRFGGPEGTCTLNPPADNGALCY